MKTFILLSLLLFLVILVTEIHSSRKPFITGSVIMLYSINIALALLLAFYLPKAMSLDLGFIPTWLLLIGYIVVPSLLVRVFTWAWQRRDIAIADFLGKDKHIYRSEIGFRKEMIRDARKTGIYDLFKFYVGENYYDIVFFDPVTNLFYGIAREKEILIARCCDRESIVSPFIGKPGLSQIQKSGRIIGSYNDAQSIWNSFSSNGESLEQVLSRSYITYLD